MQLNFKNQEEQEVDIDTTSLEQEIMESQDVQYQYLVNLQQILQDSDPDNAPTMSQVEAWKDKYDNIYISNVVDPDKYYVWRTLRRGEFKKVNANNEFENNTKANEILVEKCLLYPTPDQTFRFNSVAGVIDTLGKQIAYQTGWISTEEALSTIRVI
jgi:hypothetical protein